MIRRLLLLLAALALPVHGFAAPEVAMGCRTLHLAFPEGVDAQVVERDWASGVPHAGPPAVLELLGCDGSTLDRLSLEAPLARIEADPLRGPRQPTWLVSTDLTQEAGSYNGPLTQAVEVDGDHLVLAQARDAAGRQVPIRLARTGKSAWQRLARGDQDQLLAVDCQPGGDGFVTTWRRFDLSHGHWRLRSRSRKGFWESDGGFPPERMFP